MNTFFRFLRWLDGLIIELVQSDIGINHITVSDNPPPMPPQTPQKPLQETQTAVPALSMLEQFCLAIRDYEGAPGDLNYINNNPGNCRCSTVGYLPKYGNVLCVETASGKFAKFPTYELGWEYLMALIQEKCAASPSYTILTFMSNYSPSVDGNDPMAYANFIAKRLGVPNDYPMSKIV